MVEGGCEHGKKNQVMEEMDEWTGGKKGVGLDGRGVSVSGREDV